MTTNKPEVVYATNLYSSAPVACLMRRTGEKVEPVIRLSDYETLQAECEKLRSKTRISLGVGDGDGGLFVHGDYDSIKRVQALIFECEKLRKDAEFGRSVLSKREPGKVYGCHCDLEEGMEPDGCVIDSGERHNCIHANDISAKEQCSHWRVIAIDAAMQGAQS